MQQLVEEARAERERQARVAAEAEEKRKADETERQRQADIKAEQERQAKVAAAAEEKRKADETERQRQADIKAEQERQAKVAAEAEEKRKANDAQAGYAAPTSAPNEVKGILGLDLVDLTDELRKKHNIKDDVRGVLITAVDPNSPAAEKRLRRGHVIAEVQQERVTSATEVQQRIEKLKKDGRKVMALLIRTPDGAPSFVALRLQ